MIQRYNSRNKRVAPRINLNRKFLAFCNWTFIKEKHLKEQEALKLFFDKTNYFHKILWLSKSTFILYPSLNLNSKILTHRKKYGKIRINAHFKSERF